MHVRLRRPFSLVKIKALMLLQSLDHCTKMWAEIVLYDSSAYLSSCTDWIWGKRRPIVRQLPDNKSSHEWQGQKNLIDHTAFDFSFRISRLFVVPQSKTITTSLSSFPLFETSASNCLVPPPTPK